jgi:hypothetical protein
MPEPTPRKNTVKRALPRKREKRQVETHDYAAFARRIIKAHAKRVADGDIEALRGLLALSSEVDAAVAEAVQGLRRFNYSWSEIATRLGVSRQAAQMRWGNRTDRGRLDGRLLDAAHGLSVGLLVAVYVDHYPGTPTPATCPGCGFEYQPTGFPTCPTLATVRPLLARRRHEDPKAVHRLTPDQLADLHGRRPGRSRPVPTNPGSGPSLSSTTVGGR